MAYINPGTTIQQAQNQKSLAQGTLRQLQQSQTTNNTEIARTSRELDALKANNFLKTTAPTQYTESLNRLTAEYNSSTQRSANLNQQIAVQNDVINSLDGYISSSGSNLGGPGAATQAGVNTAFISATLPIAGSANPNNLAPIPPTPSPFGTAPDDRYKNVFASRSPGEVPGAGGSMDPRQQRLDGANLAPGGVANNPLPQRQVPVAVFTQSGPSLALLEDDWRVRVSLGTASKLFYKGNKAGIQSVLKNTDGVVFPYTPTIQVTHQARYAEQKLTHSNYASYFFEGSEVNAITVSGDFTVQTPEEGKYLLAAITFFRSCTKMFFGKTNDQPLAGSPPPLVFLHGYGKYIFPAVPCVITQFQQTLPGEVDYLEVNHFIDEVDPTGFVNSSGQFKSEIQLLNSAVTRVPTSCQLSVTLQPVYSRKTLHEDFNLDRFASGELLIGRGGFI
jgi:hypothetical protein